MVISDAPAHILAKLSCVLPDVYRGQNDKTLDKIIERFAS
jgi:hypothetical protein